MKLRQLNDAGIEDFGTFLDRLKEEPTATAPTEILVDPEKTELFAYSVEVEDRPFSTRFDAAKYLYERFVDAGVSDIDLGKGVWAWLTLFWFDRIRPAAGKYPRNWPGERARWIPALTDRRKFYRHVLAGPWRAYRFHRDNPERARVLLCGQLHKPGEVSEQILSRQELVTNRGLVELATRMYFDPVLGKLRRGAATKTRGSARRYAEVINQFDVTWDLYAMSADEIAALLPVEFNRFLTGKDN